MNREKILAGGVLAVVALSVVSAVAAPGAIAEVEREPVRTGHLGIQEMTIAPGSVTGGTATLTVDTRLRHSHGRSENVSVLVRAVHLGSGMVETTARTNVSAIEGDREVSVVQSLSVERSGGYRIETIVYRDDERIAEGSKQVRGVGTLTPAYARTSIRFHWQGGNGLPPVEYTIQSVENNRTTLDVSTFLTNEGDDLSEELRVVFTARQADSNIVADRASVRVGTVEPGRTVTPNVTLSVPEDYNYYLDAVLWKDGVIVGTARSVANLNPTERVEANETVREVGIEVSDFEGSDESGAPNDRERETEADSANGGGTPGFTALTGVLALVGAVLLARRYA